MLFYMNSIKHVSDFIKTHFRETFSRCKILKGKRLLRDEYPVQNSKKARQALDTVGPIKFSIPHHLTDFNSTDNIFNYINSELRTQGFKKYINYEAFKLSIRVKHTLENNPTKYIDNTFEHKQKRILMVIK